MLTPQGFKTQTVPKKIDGPVQLVPHNIEAEQALLGALVIDPDQMIECSYLKKSDFYLSHNGYLYQAMADLFQHNQGYDLITLTSHLEASGHLEDIGGGGAITELINVTPTSYGAPEYAAIVYQHSISRQVINRAIKATQLAYQPISMRTGDMLVNEVIGSFSEIDATCNISGGPQPMSNGANLLLDRLEQIEISGETPGVPTGIKTLDSILGGLDRTNFYILAGRPGMGKSALALQMAYNMAKAGRGVLLFSLEMGEAEITNRITSINLSLQGYKISYKDIWTGRGDKDQIISAIDNVSRMSITIDATPALTVSQIRHRSQKVLLSEEKDIIIVDHGGLVKSRKPTGNATQDMTQNADDLMALSKQLGLPVLSLLQLNRKCEDRQDKRPLLSDLRDSGTWEQNADGVLFVYRDQYYDADTQYPHLGEVNVAKNRGGETGKVTLYTDMPTNRFVDLETKEVRL